MDEWSWLPRRDKCAPAPKGGETPRAGSYGVKKVGRRTNVRKRLELGLTLHENAADVAAGVAQVSAAAGFVLTSLAYSGRILSFTSSFHFEHIFSVIYLFTLSTSLALFIGNLHQMRLIRRTHPFAKDFPSGQRGMKFSMKIPSRCRKRVRLSCDCGATSLYSSSYRRTRVSRTYPV
ncbi:hypothetical protein Y032_0662g1297 [Ancylostoma ceylanicum]|uniref:Uncharacterized protein n=1 Tax=Ancylostoma ceylanicum TaxID=53326 RepID=A0A016WI69_9BILA|nr:hypothetical protein Y032_0662g1297 [Ancylostoma ceylanicum]